jgi:hypothetical protein
MSVRAWTRVSVALIIAFAVLYWFKPTCSEGHVPLISPFEGWVCISGYKPN